ncbi:MAG: sensor histidine kinase [Verrucomicrobia subdivision 3 bacterium]|nr:sensor histidine kinase [Limisphaerales bacterium]
MPTKLLIPDNLDSDRRMALERGRSELWRMTLLGAVLLLLIGLILALPDPAEAAAAQVVTTKAIALAFVGFMFAYAAIGAVWVFRRWQLRKPMPRVWRYVQTLFEVSTPSLAILAVAGNAGLTQALGGAAPFAYFLFIVLAALHFDFWLCAFAGAAAATQILALNWFALGGSLDSRWDILISTPAYWLKSALLLLTGLVIGFVAYQLGHRVRTSFSTKPEPPMQLLPRRELTIVLAYVAGSSLWILLSDAVLDWMENDPTDSTALQTYKGLNFVLTTAVLLFFVLRRSFDRWRRAAAKLAQSHAQLRALSARLESSREEERSRIAREIHDQLGQTLTGMKMDLRWIETRVSQHPDKTLNPVLDKVVEAGELADATIASVQKISSELRPVLLDMFGLCTAIRHEAARFEKRTGVTCRVQVPEPPPHCNQEAATAAFRIFQEALTNVSRHAEATEVEVMVTMEDGDLLLRVADNGKGIAPENIDAITSLGLLGMTERATALGGHVCFTAAVPHGTVVTLRLPGSVVKAAEPALPS